MKQKAYNYIIVGVYLLSLVACSHGTGRHDNHIASTVDSLKVRMERDIPSTDQNAKDTCKIPLPTPSFSIRVKNDSVHVDGAYMWSYPLVVPLVMKPFEYSADNKSHDTFRQERLKNPRCICLKFTEPVHSYDIRVILHPDDNHEDVGMAEWTLSNNGNEIVIETGFSWDWKSNISEPVDNIKYEGETYIIAPLPNMVQGKDSVIINSPVCFKDVDFNGKDEICFRQSGWNRYYFLPYKILTRAQAEMMTGHPYNNLVYSEFEGCSTVFDYKKQTIDLVEVSGSSVYSHSYRRRRVVNDVLDPMQHISGVESNYGGGTHEDDYYENGKWVRSTIAYQIDQIDNYAWVEVEAEFKVKNNARYLISLTLHDMENEVRQELYHNHHN